MVVDSKIKTILFVLIMLLTFAGCARKLAESNRLAIMELVRKEGTETVFLPNDYGFLIMWLDAKKPNLYLYNRPANKICMTSDFSVFLAGLEKFPSGAKVDRIRGCGITEMGMGEDNKHRLYEIIKAKKLYLTGIDDGNFTVCSCQTSNVRMFTSVNN
jgi:hypothetical protein